MGNKYGLSNLLDAAKHHGKLTKEGWQACIISVLVIAFIVSFKEWGTDSFDLIAGLLNYLRAAIIVAIAMAVLVISTTLSGLHVGYRSDFKLWWYGVALGIAIVFITRGNVWFLAMGGVFFHHLAVHRIGWFRYGLNTKETGMTCMFGGLAVVVLAVVYRLLLFIFPDSEFLTKALVVTIWFALFNMLPIPPMHGSRVFFWSRLAYFYIFGSIVGASILLSIPQLNLLITIILSLLIGGVVWLIWLWKVES